MRSRPKLASPSSSRTAGTTAVASPSSSTTSRIRRTSAVADDLPQASRSASANTARSKRKADDAPSALAPSVKRKRPAPVPKEDELRSRAERLTEKEKSLKEREKEVKKREQDVTKKRNALQRKEAELDAQLWELKSRRDRLAEQRREAEQQSKEVAARARTVAAKERMLDKRVERENLSSRAGELTEPEWALAHLEEHYTCSLCYEVMACPYSLSPGLCGHSFCSLCALKWCFALVHRGCGYWHDSLECPLCRAELPYTSDHTPRSVFSFPFTPNRIADSAIKALVDIVKSAKLRPGSSASAAEIDLPEKLVPWCEGGALYQDWLHRDRRGRVEMTMLANDWATLQADDFIAFKDRLGV
ncbi:hypothetical protein C8Q77DRAFT_209623 [Trametes polyzona]|nr:hypothetical protein C8Q77DRAFT_209623 [Trametes polyzona]